MKCWLIINMVLCFLSAPKRPQAPAQREAIVQAVREELKLHPKTTLLDIYKNFFQGRFGPGHMIDDKERARSYLLRELREATEFDSIPWQAVGHERLFFRINLSLVRDGTIAAQDLLAAFIESANAASPPSMEDWREEWRAIVKIVDGMNVRLPNLEEDKKLLAENLEKGIGVGHHSAAYRKSYHPHYRIVSRRHFERLLGKDGARAQSGDVP